MQDSLDVLLDQIPPGLLLGLTLHILQLIRRDALGDWKLQVDTIRRPMNKEYNYALCMLYLLGRSTRYCNDMGEWSEPDVSLCQSVEFTAILAEVID